MNEFKQFTIEEAKANFIGEKVKMKTVLNKTIAVYDYRVKPSRFEGDYTQIQIELDGAKRVVFTKSGVLLNALVQIPKTSFPFRATIVEENEAFKFT